MAKGVWYVQKVKMASATSIKISNRIPKKQKEDQQRLDAQARPKQARNANT